MGNIAIRVENLSKRYRIGVQEKRRDTLVGSLVHTLKAPVRNFQRLHRRVRFSDNGRADEPDVIWALKDVSFEVKHGEVVGIIGRNGAGKSTLLKILSRITEPTSGRAVLHGRVASLLEVGTGMHPELTGRENIYLNGTILGMKKAEIDRKFDEIVEFAEIAKFIDTPVKYYSSGMRVRLGFAIAAHLDPEILLVDEVLAVGDAAFQKKCLGKMGDVAKEGRTVLFVSHNMGAVQALCTRSIFLDLGRVQIDSTTQEAVSAYLYSAVAQSGEVIFGTDTVREGNGKARYVAARLFDNQGRLTNSIPMGQSVTLELQFEVLDGRLISPSFGILIQDPIGQPITRLTTRETHGQAPVAAKGGKVRLQIERLDLLPGKYYLTLGLSNLGDQADLIPNAIELEITSIPKYPTAKLPPKSSGFMYIPCSWDHQYT